MWYEIENEYSTWHFYPDSLVLKLSGYTEYKAKWQGDKSTIAFEIPTYDWDSLGKPIDTINKIQINYQLSNRGDSLFGTLKNNYGIHEFSLIKTSNYIEYLHRRFGLKFSLPKEHENELIDIESTEGMKIFMDFENHKVIAKTEYSNSLSNLEDDIKKFKDRLGSGRLEADWQKEFGFNLYVYADKKISDSLINTSLRLTVKSDLFKRHDLPRPPNNSKPINIYRIYDTKEVHEIENYSEFRKAKKIKTNAKTVFD